MTTNPIRITPGKEPLGSHLKLYEFARKKQGSPLTYLAAKRLLDTVKRGDFVFIMADAGAPPYLPVGETDGPLGVAALGRMFDIAFGAKPVVITEKEKKIPFIATCNAAELAVQSEEWFRKRLYGGALVEAFPTDHIKAKEAAQTLIAKYKPVAMVSVETLGPSGKGIIHTMGGSDWTKYTAKAEYLIKEAEKKDILTIGIGDGGNEIGFGLIRNEMRSLGGIFSDCFPQCTCRDGIVTVVATDIVLPAAVSNWGAYGIEACVAAMTGNMDAMHNETIEKRMLEAAVDHGLASGDYGKQMLDVDGTSLETNQALITILREIVKNFTRKQKPGSRGF
jgi:hypothetical protein